MRWLLPVMGVLVLLAVVVWATLPKEPVVAASPPQVVKTVSEVQKQMDLVKGNERIPAGEKSRILGFMQMEMDRAKARERGEDTPAMTQNPK
ncbi:MAG: hypothetical protein V4671_10315 [Armatimonadota bacterium]